MGIWLCIDSHLVTELHKQQINIHWQYSTHPGGFMMPTHSQRFPFVGTFLHSYAEILDLDEILAGADS